MNIWGGSETKNIEKKKHTHLNRGRERERDFNILTRLMWHYNLIKSFDSTWLSSEETVRQLLVSSHHMLSHSSNKPTYVLLPQLCNQAKYTYFIYWDQEIMKVICFVFGTISSCVDFFFFLWHACVCVCIHWFSESILLFNYYSLLTVYISLFFHHRLWFNGLQWHAFAAPIELGGKSMVSLVYVYI